MSGIKGGEKDYVIVSIWQLVLSEGSGAKWV